MSDGETSWIQIDDDDDVPPELNGNHPISTKRAPTLYHQCSRLVAKASRKVSRDAIDGSSKVVQNAFMKCVSNIF